MIKKRLVSVLLLIPLLLSLVVLPANALEEPDLYCTNACLFNATYDEVLLDKGANERAYPASITKVMTALLVMEALDEGKLTLETPITAEESAHRDLSENASNANPRIKIGETLPVEELLYSLLLPSANEAANILAVAVDGTIEDFVAHMNRRAEELGCKGTHFVNPHGLHDPDHYTTAYDIAITMKAALEYDLFRTIIKEPTHKVPPTNMTGERTQYNTNGLVSTWQYGGYLYSKCIGGKTGTTEEAGRCLVAAAENEDFLLISVILGSGPVPQADGSQPKQGQFTETVKLLEWGLNSFQRVTITQPDEPVDSVAVTMSRDADEVLVKPQGSITRTLPKDLDLSLLETQVSLFQESVEAPVEKGQTLGTMTLSYQGEVYGTLDLVAVTGVERSQLLYIKNRVETFFHRWGILIAVVAVVLVVLLLRFHFSRRRSRRNSYRSRRRRNYTGRRY